MRYYGAGLDLPTNFHLISTPWEAEAVGAHVAAYEDALPDGAWPNYALGNHDRPRIASRAGPAQARVAAVLLLTLRGTPTLYYGDELGLRDVARPARPRAGPVGAARAGPGPRARSRAHADAVVRRSRTPASARRTSSRGCRWTPTTRGLSVAAQQRDPRLAADALPPAAGAAPRRARARARLLARAARAPTACSPTCAAGASSSRSTSPREERARRARRPAPARSCSARAATADGARVARELRLAGDDAVVVRLS